MCHSSWGHSHKREESRVANMARIRVGTPVVGMGPGELTNREEFGSVHLI